MENQNKKIRNKLISGAVTVILILSICVCLFAFVQVVNKGYVSFFGYSFFKVTTGSMEPTISVGSLILTKDVEIDTLEINDVVSFFSKEAYLNGKIITHRVVEKETSGTGQVLLTTRGDANSSTDIHRVDESNLIGKVVWISGEGNVFAKLIICRNAYWKIAGKEMGLGKPWEPDWGNDNQFKYIIICRRDNVIKDTYTAKNCILAFPTAEMRDAFYEAFKEDIEKCKELL